MKYKCPKCGNIIRYENGECFGDAVREVDPLQVCICGTHMEKVV